MNSNSGAYASVFYLPKCNDCGNRVDKAGESVDFHLYGPSKLEVMEISKRSYSNVEGNEYYGCYIREQGVAKCEFYKTPDHGFLEVILTGENTETVRFLKERFVSGEQRLYYTTKNKWFDPEFDSHVFVVIDTVVDKITYDHGSFKNVFKLNTDC